MKITKLNSGSAIFAQLKLLILLLPLVIYFSYWVIRDLTLEKISVLLPIYIILFLIYRNGFSYFDIFDAGDKLVVRNVFFKKSISKDQVKDVDTGILPITFCLLLKDGSRFFFQSSIYEFYKNSDDILSSLKDKIFIKN